MLEIVKQSSTRSLALVVFAVLANVGLALWSAHPSWIVRYLPALQAIVLVMFMRSSYYSKGALQRAVGLLTLSMAPYAADQSQPLPMQVLFGTLGGLAYWLFLPISDKADA